MVLEMTSPIKAKGPRIVLHGWIAVLFGLTLPGIFVSMLLLWVSTLFM